MKKQVFAILAAGCLWGFMGFFTRNLTRLGFDSPAALIVRISVAAVLFAVTILAKDPRLFRIRLKHLWCFLGSGVCSLLFFTYCYFQTIRLTSLSVAAVLLYTAPSMVMVMSLFLFREKLTARKVLALALAFAGCCLVSGVLGGGQTLSTAGLIYGLCSGLGYALYSIFARLALDRGYDSRTINFYSCVIAVLGAAVIWGVREPFTRMFSSGENVLWCLATGVVSCYLPYLLYTYGLTGVEAGKASVMASLEPAVATVVGVVVFHEPLTVPGLAGILLVLLAIVLLNLSFSLRRGKKKERETRA